MIILFSVFGLLALIIYLYVCRRENSYINAITPYFAFYFATCYLFEPLHFGTTTDYEYDVAAFAFVYTCDFAFYLGLVVAYVSSLSRANISSVIELPPMVRLRAGYWAWGLLAISAVIFLPVALEFREYILDPRRIYELTRTGYGQYFYASALAINLSIILFLFSNRKTKMLFVPVVLVLSLIKGSKGGVLTAVYIVAMWLIYVRGWRVGLRGFLLSISTLIALVAGLFAITFSRVDDYKMLNAIAGYSDYNRNAALTVTDPVGPFYGRLALENIIYSRVPRFIFPNKPKNFGGFVLAEYYFPDSFDQNQGVPAFGAGLLIADFSYLSPLIAMVLGLLNGYLLAVCMNWLRRGGGIAAFIVMLYFVGVSLIPLGAAFLAIEHWILGIGMGKLIRVRLYRRPQATGRRRSPTRRSSAEFAP